MSEENTMKLLLIITNSFSAFGSIFIILAFMTFTTIRSFAFKLVFFMSISDLVHSFCLMLPPTGFFCKLQGFILQFSGVSSVLWSFNIAYSLYITAIKQESDPSRLQRKFLLLAYFFPFLVAFIPVVTDSYNYAVGWCWIKKDFITDLFERIFCFYLMLWIVIPFNLTVYWKVVKKIREEFGAIVEQQAENNAIITRLCLYPMVLILCYLPITIKRSLEITVNLESPFWFTCLSAFGISVLGFANAVVYGLSGPVREAIKGVFIKNFRAQSVFSLYTRKFSDTYDINI